MKKLFFVMLLVMTVGFITSAEASDKVPKAEIVCVLNADEAYILDNGVILVRENLDLVQVVYLSSNQSTSGRLTFTDAAIHSRIQNRVDSGYWRDGPSGRHLINDNYNLQDFANSVNTRFFTNVLRC